MNVSVPDIHHTLEYRADTAIVRLLPVGLALLFLGLLGFALYDADRPSAEIILASSVLVAVGLGITAFALWRRSNRGGPVFVLSPMGVHYRIPAVKNILIPWREIRGIDAIEITSWNWSIRNPGTMTFHDVAVILVSKQFYKAHIFIDSLFLRGPAWGNIFIPKGEMVQVALHHELVSAEPRALRKEVEARWHAFRNQPPAEGRSFKQRRTSVPAVMAAWKKVIGQREVATGSDPGSVIVAAGDNPKAISAWEAVQIIIPLIGIAIVLTNLLGLWATEGQIKAREEHKKSLERDAQMQSDRKKLDEQLKKSREEMDRTWREFNRRF